MTNHTHLLVSAKEKGALSACMQELGRKFVSTTNRIRSRTGGLWEGRFYAGYLEPEGYLLRCMRYIELNPVRAKMVANAGAYRWSSFSANATGRENVMITPHPVYQKLGDTQEARAYAYRKSFDEEPEGVDRSVIDEEIRSATRQGVLIAGTTYAADVARRLNREVTAKPRGRPKKKGPEKGA